jgi:hypothetical protein
VQPHVHHGRREDPDRDLRGDATYAGAAGTTSHTVNKATPVVAITSDTPDPSTVNSAYAVAVSVTSIAGTPTGSVSVSDGNATCTIAALSSGAGSCNLTSTTSGAKTLTATYNGDANFLGASGTAPHQVNNATATVSITSDTPDPSTVGQSFAVAFSVTGSSGTPTGNVTVSDGSATCNSALTGGAGSCNLTSTTAGAKTLTASYGGDGTYGSSSGTTAHTVNKATPTVAIPSDTPDPSGIGVPYTVNVTVTGAGTTPTGAVTVSDGSANCSIAALAAGAGSCDLTSTGAGAKTLTATYAGDGNYVGASGTAAHTVNKLAPTVAITSDTPDPSTVGASYPVAFTVSGSAARRRVTSRSATAARTAAARSPPAPAPATSPRPRRARRR